MVGWATMKDLEPISHRECGRAPLQVAVAGRTRHPAKQFLHRHRHDTAYAAVVLRGSYVEAGDTGRHRLTAGAAGFADQAHMGNAVRRLTGLSPTALRRRSRQLSYRLPIGDPCEPEAPI
jgi:AraC-like DNA-binding protein